MNYPAKGLVFQSYARQLSYWRGLTQVDGSLAKAYIHQGELQQALGKRRIRLTRQRRVILQVMDDAEQHLDVDQILERAQKIDSGVALVTVYRTIDLLKKHGLIDELDLLHLRGDRHYYETHGPRDHIHVACLGCGKVREFESRLYEQLKQQIARDMNMKVTLSRTEVGGYCADCLAQEK